MAACHNVYSVADYLEILKNFSRYGLDGCRDNVQIYFRGEPEDYGETAGQPGIARGNRLEGDNESDLFRECERRLSHEFINCKSTFEKLVLMQHYGIPTRVLDVSIDSLQALFFALYHDPKYPYDDKKDSVVLVYEVPKESIRSWHSDVVSVISNIAVYHYDDLDIRGLSNSTDEFERKAFNENDSIKHLLHEIRAEKPYFESWIKKDNMESVYCVHPLLDNPRIRSQQGAFLLFGMDGDKHHLATLETNKGPEIRLAKLLIPYCAKARIREELNLLGRTIDTVYPDWTGVSDYFSRFYGKNPEEYYP
ncbi:FRG domain-containing protein [uncultured Fibrobacter sp.]|uniref:FRG domain-containing protein n=1 Tax=uncultured Fibrobacter sp. TaxID=261512 RepID=UPI00260738BF|nr:FRG domain-containing protein [uncultured Fibrobacter sp.]